MARAGRKRKINVARFPNGEDIRREEQPPSPTLVKRASMMALVGLCDPMYGTVAGVFYLSRKIDADEYEAAKRFAEIHSKYIRALGVPRLPISPKMERGQPQAPIDVDSDAGVSEADMQVDITDKYQTIQMILKSSGKGVEEDLIRFCDGVGQSPCGWESMLRVRKGLSALVTMWKIKAK